MNAVQLAAVILQALTSLTNILTQVKDGKIADADALKAAMQAHLKATSDAIQAL